MSVSFGDLLTDLKESRYFQVWCIMWAVVSIVFFIGFGNITNTAGQNQPNSAAQAYRIQENDASSAGIIFPMFQVSTLAKNLTIQVITCQSPDNVPVNVVTGNTGDAQVAYNVQAQTATAKPTKTEMGCVIMLSAIVPGESGRLRLTFSESGDFLSGETIYVPTDSYGTVYLSKTVYASGTSYMSYYNPWHIAHKMNGTYVGSLLLYVTINDFNIVQYAAFNPYTGWQAYADVGGLLMFAYVMHGILMLLIGAFLTNDSRVLKGARGSYDTVQ